MLVLLLLLILIAGIGLYGYRYYHDKHLTKSAAAISSQTTDQQKSTTGTQPSQPTTQYLTIPEWGVKIPLSDSIKDAYYVWPGASNDEDGLESAINLGVASLNSSCGEVSSSNQGYDNALGGVVRTLPTDTDPVSGKLYSQLEPNGVTIGGYYYGYADASLKKKTCASQATLQAIDLAFSSAIKNMVSAGPSWQLYTSKIGGFQFIHPADWKVIESSQVVNAVYINSPLPTNNTQTNGRVTNTNYFTMTLWIGSNPDATGPPIGISNGTVQKLTNAFNIWTPNPQSSNHATGTGTVACPEMQIVNSSSTHFSNVLPNGKNLAVTAGYCMGEGDTTTLTYQQQLASHDWQTASSIVQWIQWAP